ncbi:MAG: hypothetical protein HQL87_14095 [Magnetococcales bacterium]|nr:hypothetical protein [Magnetococcales bacterium]
MTEVLPLKSIAGAGNARSVGEFAPGDVMDPVYVGITGAASTILTSNLAAGVLMATDGSGKAAATTVTVAALLSLSVAVAGFQAQIDGKQATVTGAATTILTANLAAGMAVISDSLGKVAVSSTTTATELSYVHGVTSAIQAQIDGKQATITGAATTILTSNLATNMVMVSDGSGRVAVSSITTTELSYLNNVTSDLQVQIDSKAAREAGQITVSANYTLVLPDSGKQILHPLADASNRTVTIPANATVPFPINTEIWFVNQVNTLTIAIALDTLRLAGTTTNGNRSLAANGVARAVKVSATVWYIMGWGLS